MSKKTSAEEVVVDFFQNGELAKVETVNNIIKGIVKRRLSTKPNAISAKKPSRSKDSVAIIQTTVMPPAVKASPEDANKAA